ncbi:MAG: DNA glycosylase [Chloroherpetonaceae bacterium]|nr:DNA glycosylase [Chloroherpetonaceae bacterium]
MNSSNSSPFLLQGTYFSGEISFLSDFDLESTLFCGQAFRWQRFFRNSEIIYAGVLDEAVVWVHAISPKRIRFDSTKATLYFRPCNEFLEHYFGKNDQPKDFLPAHFEEKYPHLSLIFNEFGGLHLLRQPLYETLISFMCAQGVGITLIRRQVSRLADLSGQTLQNADFVASRFPTPSQLASFTLHKITYCTNNNRIRAKNILAISQAIAEGRLNLDYYENLSRSPIRLKKEHYHQLREDLLRFDGIGEKIADCVCLFGLGAWHAFPIDTHVRQFMIEWFGIRMKGKTISAKNYAKIQKKAWKELGENAGYLSQILFHYWRTKIRGLGVE